MLVLFKTVKVSSSSERLRFVVVLFHLVSFSFTFNVDDFPFRGVTQRESIDVAVAGDIGSGITSQFIEKLVWYLLSSHCLKCI